MRFYALPLSFLLPLSLSSHSFSMWVRVAQRASNVCLYSGGSEAAFGQGASGSPLTPPHRTEAGWKVNGPGAGACGTWKRAQKREGAEGVLLMLKLHRRELITCDSGNMHMVHSDGSRSVILVPLLDICFENHHSERQKGNSRTAL